MTTVYTWAEFVHSALLEIKNGWPIRPEDKVEFQDHLGNNFTILPSHVVITLTKKVSNDNNPQ